MNVLKDIMIQIKDKILGNILVGLVKSVTVLVKHVNMKRQSALNVKKMENMPININASLLVSANKISDMGMILQKHANHVYLLVKIAVDQQQVALAVLLEGISRELNVLKLVCRITLKKVPLNYVLYVIQNAMNVMLVLLIVHYVRQLIQPIYKIIIVLHNAPQELLLIILTLIISFVLIALVHALNVRLHTLLVLDALKLQAFIYVKINAQTLV